MMKHVVCSLVLSALLVGTVTAEEDGWVELFDGKSLDGWKANENLDSFKYEDGKIVANGPRSHLFYVGDVNGGEFKNFEFKAKVKTFPKANSGIYFHTTFLDEGWPDKGYECQVNNTGSDKSKTGGLYAVQINKKIPVKDEVWFDYYIKVEGKHIVIKVNGETISDYTEPDDLDRPERQVGTGTFAFQAHDPGSRVEYKDIKVKVLK